MLQNTENTVNMGIYASRLKIHKRENRGGNQD
jgi:hypothetical protein